jgi:predicted acylesterase/phospholipase RssA
MGAMFQIGALAALEDAVEELEAHHFGLYVGAASGASVAAVLAGGQSVQRIYRAFLDPADVYFGLERKHLLRIDAAEWRRTLVTALAALRHGASSLFVAESAPPARLFEELERLYDSLPAGLFALDRYERFLEDLFVRRDVPNSFHAMPHPLRVIAHDLDSGEQVLFGAPGFAQVPVTRACIASMAVPPFFSPVRIGDRHYIDAAHASYIDVAVRDGANVIVVVNPMVPVDVESVPTGHGRRDSIRDKGMMWVLNQANRIGAHQLLHESCERVVRSGDAEVLLIEPEPSDGVLFMYNPTSFSARRSILEYAYRSTRTRLARGFELHERALARAGWRPRALPDTASP